MRHSAGPWSSAGQHIFVYLSTNSQQYLKKLYGINQGPRWDCLMKKKPEVENLVTQSLLVKTLLVMLITLLIWKIYIFRWAEHLGFSAKFVNYH
jgi:hypothetical protein